LTVEIDREARRGPTRLDLLSQEEKMRVRMLMDRRGSPDGVTAVPYKAGEAYDLPTDLAVPWLAKGYCEQDKMDKGPDEVKDETQSKDGAGGRAGKAGRKKK
jgi:hypothetical protein